MDLTVVYALLGALAFKALIAGILYCIFYRRASKEAIFASATYNVVKLGAQQGGKPKVVVTGGCGHLGREVTSQLVEHFSDRIQVAVVDAVVRPPYVPSVTYIQGDVCDRGHMSKTFRGATCVLHLASVEPSAGTSPSFIQRVNTQGTKNMMETCLETDVRSVVYASSGAVFMAEGGAHATFVKDDAPYANTTTSGYSESKRKAEVYVLSGSSAYLRTVVLRTGMVYSQSDNWLGSGCLARKFAVVGDGRQKVSLVWVKDVARAFVLAVEALVFATQTKGQDLAGKAFNLSHEPVTDPVMLGDFVRVLSHGQQGAKGRVAHTSLSLALLKAHINDWLASSCGLPIFGSHHSIENIRMLTSSPTLDISGARDVLRWWPTPWQQAVAAIREEYLAKHGTSTTKKQQ